MDFKKSRITILKILISVVFLFLLTLPVNYYINYNYSKTLNTFYSEFNQCNFDDAKEALSDNSFILKLKKKVMTTEVSKYFTSIITTLCNELKNNNIDSNQAVAVFKEIKSYDILDESLDKLILTLDQNYISEDSSLYKSYLDLALEKYNAGEFSEAINMFSKIPYSQLEYYNTAQDYIERCKSSYKKSLFEEADKLASEDYYTKAIDLLSSADTSILSSNDKDIENKISSIEIARDEYLASDYYIDNAQPTSTSLLQNLNTETINTLNIESNTPYFVYVNLNDQKTYVYEGTSNNWTLEKEFDCSTGIESEATPKGVYTVTGRGDWFYSDQYEQGGKYWVQFWGDYLFHSLPYDESQSTIVDYTLGVPASHGCIRLAVEDSKWLFDNMPDDTKVIIN
ncbi:L%2CD-transpeptidase catalytic domain [uncultured Clostridium sp.]|uniref:L,D-transpeptidase n=1 Tax=uncultured Clostridium sp. TaxID=59620 RepID=UPI0008216C71|nr:L,D-transpeptidase [uncultured Clostridium sp.]SCJ94636.1 L%2CD-transpeptidase catalytic domain [uncultured Clostridium sp.]